MTNVTILKFHEDKVEFTSSLGKGVAVWCGEPPQTDGRYHVELDVDDTFEWGRNIESTNEKTPVIKIIDNKFSFIAQVLSYEDDGILTISLGGEVIFLDVNSSPGTSKYVSFSTSINNVFLHPVEF
ncbi:hypothetical protein [Superficieibacter sp. HKU1]|uniref:hypothetical protein n=1 Tax=Superficieibacter sp. HKU1 TaxID=3031919 RepID=UPI0023E1D031|nr:hypothetical protein [Superficieibacter sp. HKU1]WES68091.1 hypothetical protein P0H77_21230 [Superficieibacter sp. HKU1]